MLPIAAEIATRLTREQAHSARPDAPVFPVEATRQRTSFVSRVVDLARPWTGHNDLPSARPAPSPRPVRFAS
ncbi:MAG TPA: hypothetical protein VEX15_18190 [Nocardioidaceae bacterium]|nr:hypothetical protein [Nocardioidaceae bacterium]